MAGKKLRKAGREKCSILVLLVMAVLYPIIHHSILMIHVSAQQVQLFRPKTWRQLYPSFDNSNTAFRARSSFHNPVLKVKSQEGFLPETAIAGTLVRTLPSPTASPLQILVEDKDLTQGMPSAIYQYILTGYGADRFAVDQRGNLYLNSNDIDVDKSFPKYTLRVVARETDTEPIRTSAPISITIHIFDEAEFELPQSIYVANVSAVDANERVIAQIKINNNQHLEQFHYRIVDVSDEAENSFRYNEASNELVAIGPLVPGHIYQVTIEANDGVETIAQAIVIVQAIVPSSPRPSNLFASNQFSASPTMLNTQLPHFKQQSTPRLTTTTMSNYPNVALIPAHLATTIRPVFPQEIPTLMPPTFTSSQSSFVDQQSVKEDNLLEHHQQHIDVELNEATPANSIITILGDENTFRKVYFRIQNGNEAGKFSINAETGAVSTISTVDREKQGAYHLQIEARSRQPDQLLYMTNIRVIVLDANDNAPEFVDKRPILIKLRLDGTAINYAKFAQPNIFLGKINVQDRDQDDNGKVSLKILSPMDKLFTINDKGELSINEMKFSDHGQPPLESRTVVTVQIETSFDSLLKKNGVIGVGAEPLANAIASSISSSKGSASEDDDTSESEALGEKNKQPIYKYAEKAAANPVMSNKLKENRSNNFVQPNSNNQRENSKFEVLFTRATPFPTTTSPLFTRISPPIETATEAITTIASNALKSTSKAVSSSSDSSETKELLKQISFLLPQLKPEVISKKLPASELNFAPKANSENKTKIQEINTAETKFSKQLAPYFISDYLELKAPENAENVIIGRAKARYLDNKQGQISYVLEAGDASLIAINSSTGEIRLLRALDAEAQQKIAFQVGTMQGRNGESYQRSSQLLPHSCNISLLVEDVNDFAPIFESENYEFALDVPKQQGVLIVKVFARDKDATFPNNDVNYSILKHSANFDRLFTIHQQNGEIRLAKELKKNPIANNESIVLTVIAKDGGKNSLESRTQVQIKIRERPKENTIGTQQQLSSYPSEPKVEKTNVKESIRFAKHSYFINVTESEIAPLVVLTLQILNKPRDTRFIMCAFREGGDYRGAFSVTPNFNGDCELRTQVRLDRETIPEYRLNISAELGSQMDFAIVTVLVLDINDNAPRFVFDSDEDASSSEPRQNEYFSVISVNTNASTPFVTVKAEDFDIDANGIVEFSFDQSPASNDCQHFFVGKNNGKVAVNKPVQELLKQSKKDYFTPVVLACDKPLKMEQQLCSKAKLNVNILDDRHKFITLLRGTTAENIRKHEKEMIKSIRQFTGSCSIVAIEKAKIKKEDSFKLSKDNDNNDKNKTDEMTKVLWYAMNPETKRLCQWNDLRRVFSEHAKAELFKKWKNWAELEEITSANVSLNANNGLVPSAVSSQGDTNIGEAIVGIPINWAAIPLIFWIIAGTFISLLFGICILCGGLKAWHDRSYRRRTHPPPSSNGRNSQLILEFRIYRENNFPQSPRRLITTVGNNAGSVNKTLGNGLASNYPSTIYPAPSQFSKYANGNVVYAARTMAEMERIRGNEANNGSLSSDKFYETQMLELPIGDEEGFSHRIMRPLNNTPSTRVADISLKHNNLNEKRCHHFPRNNNPPDGQILKQQSEDRYFCPQQSEHRPSNSGGQSLNELKRGFFGSSPPIITSSCSYAGGTYRTEINQQGPSNGRQQSAQCHHRHLKQNQRVNRREADNNCYHDGDESIYVTSAQNSNKHAY